MECRRFVFKRGLKCFLNNRIDEAQRDFSYLHDLVNDNPILHPLSHLLLLNIALSRRDKRLVLKHIWLATCAPFASLRNTFLKNQ